MKKELQAKVDKVLAKIIMDLAGLDKKGRELYWIELSDFEKGVFMVALFKKTLTK